MAPWTRLKAFTKAAGHSSAYTQQITVTAPSVPQAVEIWTAGSEAFADFPAASGFTGLRYSRGITAAPGASRSVAIVASETDGGFGTTNDGGNFWTRAINVASFGGFGIGLEAAADVQSYDNVGGGTYGVTLNWVFTTSAAPDRQFFMRIYGGLEAAAVTTLDYNQAMSTADLTGVGFCADHVRVLGGLTAPDEASYTGGILSVGYFNHPMEQGCVSIRNGGFSGTSIASRAQRTSACGLLLRAQASPDITLHVAATAMTSDGATFQVTNPNGQAGTMRLAFLSLKGIASKVFAFTKKADGTGVQALSALPFTPFDLELASWQAPADTAAAQHARIAIGATDGTTSLAAAGQETHGIAATAEHANGYSRNNALFAKVDNNTETLDALAVLSALDATPDLNWTTNDADADQILCVALGDDEYGVCEPDEDEEEIPFNLECVDDLTDADLISFRWDAGDSQMINRVICEFDYDATTGAYTKMLIFSHNDSVRLYGPRPEVRIRSQGLRTENGADAFFETRAREIFRRYGDAPPAIAQGACFYRKGVIWEPGDIICLTSSFIPNLLISGRGIVDEPFELMDVRPEFGGDGKLVFTMIDVEALSDQPPIPVSVEEPTASGPEDGLTMLGLGGVPVLIFEDNFT